MPRPKKPAARDALSNGIDMVELGTRIRDERLRRNLGLEGLSERSQVSRSMLSAVERGQKVPTVLVLDRIATALGTSIARLLTDESRSKVLVLRQGEQEVVRDAAGSQGRILSPTLPGVEFEFVRTTIDPGADAGGFSPHAEGSREYVAVERGTLRLTIDGTPHLLNAGDSVCYDGNCRHGFSNPGRTPCVYYLAIETAGGGVMSHQAESRRDGLKRSPRTRR